MTGAWGKATKQPHSLLGYSSPDKTLPKWPMAAGVTRHGLIQWAAWAHPLLATEFLQPEELGFIHRCLQFFLRVRTQTCHGWVGVHELTLENRGALHASQSQGGRHQPTWPHYQPTFPRPPPYPVTGPQPSPHPVLREHVAAWGKIMSLPHFPSLEEALVDWGGSWSNLLDQAEKSAVFSQFHRQGQEG